ncbi:hypothetical protein PALB_32790 [Pseudoalteromonas luteoviolacea B = ATCC 29581]|nr:hypothetical protein PALB_32790 [Pseudoalteromonas luteoviolacea B = ATCC 29581]
MAITLKQVKKLEKFKVTERHQILSIALSLMDVKSKIIMRICKLLLLTPVFASLAYFEGWSLLPILLVAGLLYPLLTAPIEIAFGKKYFDEAIQLFEKQPLG